MKSPLLSLSIALGLTLAAGNLHAADVTWTGGNYTWVQPDSDSFNATYNSGDNAAFTNTGITDGTTGKTAIVISGMLTPGDLTFDQTGARFAGATGSPGAVGFNYLFTQAGTSNVINSTGNLTLNGGNTIFRAITTSGTYSNTFAGALNYSGGVMLGISSDNAARIATVQVGSLATPTAGNSIVFNAITVASSNTSGTAWSASTNRLIVTGSKPSVASGMVSAGLQFYTGGNVLGEFMTFDGNNLVTATSGYTTYSGDWAAAGSTEIVNVTTVASLTGSGTLNIHALRVNGNQNLGGRTVVLGSGGFITTSATTSNGTLDFGSGPGYIGAYNASSQGEISALISGSGGLTIAGVSQGLRLTNNSNNFTGGLFINGGSLVLGNAAVSGGFTGATAANGNNVTVNDLGALAVNVSVTGGAVIGGLSGNGYVAPQYQLNNSNNRTITISPTSGTHSFDGTLRNGAGGSVLSVIKSGLGTQIFGADSVGAYTGTTTVSAGTLLINGNFASANGTVTVSGGILGGNGTIGGATTIQSGGTLAPGNSSDVLTFNSSLDLAGTITMDINGLTRDTQYDGINVAGALTYGGNMSLTFGSAFLSGGATFDLFSIGAGGQSGTFNSIASSSFYTFTLNGANSYSAADQLGNT